MEIIDRRILACERCSRRKQRCDRKLPTCSQCLRARADCRENRGESVMTRSAVGAIQHKGFVEILEGRLEHLQMLAHTHGVDGSQKSAERESLMAASNPASDMLRNQSMEDLTRNDIPRHERHVQFQSPMRLDSAEGRSRRHSPEIGLLSLSAMAEPNCRAAEFLKGISMPGIISAVTETYGGNPQKTTRMDALWDGIAKDIRQSTSDVPERLFLPTEDALQYVKTYYDVVDYRYPHLPREGVMCGIRAITASEPAEYAATLQSDPAMVFMAYMVLAITPLVSDTYPVAQASFISIHILSKALKILDKVFQHEDGVDIIYCLILLVIFSFHSSAAGSTWHLTGVAMKKCIALGFHREVTRPRPDTSEEDLEQRRWAFWSCYFLDRPFSINDRDITIELPGSRLPFSTRLSHSQRRYIHLYRYGILQSKIAADKGQRPFSYRLNHLLNWETNVPVLEPYSLEQEQHFISLLNTLTLRVLTDQIIFTNSADPVATNLNGAASSPSFHNTFTNHAFLQLREVVSCSQAVISSLNRRSMQRRSTLSWITGFTSIRACLGLLCCLHCSRLNLCPTQLTELEVQECENFIDIGIDVLSVVARQFPVMQDYRSLIVNLRPLRAEASIDTALKRAQILQNSDFIGPGNIYALVVQISGLLDT